MRGARRGYAECAGTTARCSCRTRGSEACQHARLDARMARSRASASASTRVSRDGRPASWCRLLLGATLRLGQRLSSFSTARARVERSLGSCWASRSPLRASASCDDRLRDRGLRRLLDQRHAVVADFDHRRDSRWAICQKISRPIVSWAFFRLIWLSRPTRLTTIFTLSLIVHLAERHHQPHDVAQAGQIELRDQQDVVGHFQRHQVDRRVALRQVDDQVRERGLQQADHAPQVVGRDQGRRLPAARAAAAGTGPRSAS